MIHVSFITINRNITYINEAIDSCIENSTVPVKINVYSGCEDISFIKNKERINDTKQKKKNDPAFARRPAIQYEIATKQKETIATQGISTKKTLNE